MISEELVEMYVDTLASVSGIPREEILGMPHADRQQIAEVIAGRMRTRLDLFERASREAEVVLKLNDDVEEYIRTRDGEAE